LGVTGFANALIEVGWLKAQGDGFSIPKFDAHNSKSAKNRALASRRKVTQRSRSERDKSVTREEKRREDTSLVVRPVGTDERRKIEKINWGEVANLANRFNEKISKTWSPWKPSESFREKFLPACALVVAGIMPEAWLADAIAAMLDGDRKRKPAAYLGKVLARTAADRGQDWDAYRAEITIPERTPNASA
jgi:hypothetical protein